VRGLIGGPGDVASAFGATVLQEALEWLLGGLKGTITLALVKYLVHVDLAVGQSLARLTGPMIVVGGFFLVVGLITSIGDGYREIVAGTDTAARVIGQAIFRAIGLAILLGSWFWIVPLATDVANGVSGYVLSDGATGSALRRTFASEWLLDRGFPLLGLLTGVMLAFAILLLVVLKFVIAIAFAALYVGGPALIGFAALPRIGNLPLAIATRGLLTLTAIPLIWTVVFAAWAGVSAGTFDTAAGDGGVIGGLMGPGLFLAGLVVMLGVTKKVLAMATLGVGLAVPGAMIARSAVVATMTRRLGGALRSASVDAATTRASSEGLPTTSRARTDDGAPGVGRPVPEASARAAAARPRRELQVTDRVVKPFGPEEVARHHSASAANAVLHVEPNGAFAVPHAVSHEAVADAAREVEYRRAEAAPSAEEVRQAGKLLTAADRTAFALAAEVASREEPIRAQRHFARAMSRQIAAAPAIDSRERAAAITVASADPQVVRDAFAPTTRSFELDRPPSSHGYDPRLMDPSGGLDRFRDQLGAKRPRSQGDEEPGA
jgi:hypothetical protein